MYGQFTPDQLYAIVGFGSVYLAGVFAPEAKVSTKAVGRLEFSADVELNGAFSEYTNITQGSSITNVQTNVTRSEFESNLIENGFVADPLGGINQITNYTNDGIKYTVRNNAGSTGGPTADVYVNSIKTVKIRLK